MVFYALVIHGREADRIEAVARDVARTEPEEQPEPTERAVWACAGFEGLLSGHADSVARESRGGECGRS